MIARRARRARLLAAGAASGALLLASGCGFTGLENTSLPGGPTFGKSTYPVTAVFDNVEDLVPQSDVRVNDVAVGTVSSVTLTKHYRARVTMRILKSVHIPANSVAILEQTTLLGEKYIALGPPPGVAPRGVMRPGTVIPDDATQDYPQVEQVFSILSDVLNGGGLANIETINDQLAQALAGREANVKDLLTQLDTFVTSLNAQRASIVDALHQLDTLSATLAANDGTLATGLADLGPGLKVLAANVPQTVQLLQGLATLGRVGGRVIEASRVDTVANLNNLAPVLTRLAAAAQNLPKSLELLADYPFPKDATNAIPGDYTGLRITLAADTLFRILAPPTGPAPSPVPLPGSGSGSPSPVPLPKLPVPVPSLPAAGSLLPSSGASAPATGGSSGLGGLLGGALG